MAKSGEEVRLFKNDDYSDDCGVGDIVFKHLRKMYTEIDDSFDENFNERDLSYLIGAEAYRMHLDRLLEKRGFFDE